ncbi:MAG: polyribonucleotide nucleotidyltransferase [Oscillospiraceae bacterium]|nr:polyribonucleotide nucleotidyltransferase [Oscillospiraceae bacterium]
MQFTTHEFETLVGGRTMKIEVGKMAGLSNGSCLVRYGDTVVLVNATASAKPRDGIDFFPLSVDYEEKLYSVGHIPGSWGRREGRPGEKAILTSRVIDRPIRPLFPKDMRNDVCISCTVMSVEQDNSPEICAMIGTSVALSISDIPWNGPTAALNVGFVDGKYVINPTEAQRAASTLALTVAGSLEKVVMIEAGANEIPNDIMYNAIMLAHEEIKPICRFISDIQAKIGKPKFDYPQINVPEEMFEDIKSAYIEDMRFAMDTDDKTVRDANLAVLKDKVLAELGEKYPDSEAAFDECLYKLEKFVVRRWLLDDKKRVDGRRMDQVRPLAAEVGILPRVHGSGMFTRGQTQVLTTCTLGTVADYQPLDGISPETTKRYMHHYNFPSWSVGEARAARSPGRREIGHGALAERALEPVIPTEAEFPYCIRLVSEVLSSNGSTSQGSVCGSTLALMDAGVPIKAPVAGISCGLITEEDRWMVFTDIQGVEDFFGDMDFKVAGTHKGITSIQMDLKIDGLTPEIIKAAFEMTHKGRDYIIDEIILKAIPAPREEVNQYAPKMIIMKIKPEKIREVIGKGGEVIQKIVADTGAKIDIEDDGTVYIAAVNRDSGLAAQKIIEGICFEPEVGAVYTGKVTRIIPIGAFVEFAPGKEGMCHIKDLSNTFVEKVEDVVNEGDMLTVKFMGVDEKGRYNLSAKALLPKLEGESRPPRRENAEGDGKKERRGFRKPFGKKED